MGGQSKTKQTQSHNSTSTQSTTLNPQYQAITNDLMAQAQKAMGAISAPIQQGMGAIGEGINNVRDTIAGKFLDGTGNPILSNLVNSGVAKARDALAGTLTQYGDVSQQQGAYGGSRQGMMEGVAQAEFAKNALDISNQVYYDNYQRERQNQVAAPAALSSYMATANQGFDPVNNLARIVAMMAPFNSTTTGNSSGTGTSTTTQSANPIDQMIKIASLFVPTPK